MADKKPKVLFTFVEAGMGHIIPMKGVSDAFEQKYGDKCKIVRSYVFRDSKYKAVNKMGVIQDNHTRRLGKNKIYRALESLSYSFSSKFTLWCLDIFYNKARKLFIKDLKEFNADMVVSTYYLPSHIAKQANQKGQTDSLIVTYVPDPYIYPAWDRECDRLFVLDEGTRLLAEKSGFKKDNVVKVPFVYKKTIIDGWMEKSTAREKLGLSENGYVLLYSAGAYGSSDSKKLIKEILKLNIELECVVICGKNEKMYQDFCEIQKNNSSKVKLITLGFVKNLNEYMCASDLVIGKSALMTIMEAYYHGLPFIMHNEQSRLEQEIAKYAVQQKLAIKEHNCFKVAKLVEKDVFDRGYLKTLLDRKDVRPENGASIVADELYKLLKTKYPKL